MQEGLPPAGTPMTGGGSVLPRFTRPQVTARTVVTVVFTLLAILGGLYLLWQLRQIVRWTVIALFLAVALNPAVGWLQRRHIKRGLAILLVYLALLAVIAGMAALVLPPLVDQVDGLVQFGTDLARQPGGPEQGLRSLAERFGLGEYYDTLRAQLATLPERAGALARPLVAFLGGLATGVTAFISILLLTFFLLLDGERFVNAFLQLFNPAQHPRLRRLLGQSAGAVSGYITGNLTISLIAGVTTFIVLTVLRMPYAVALALIVALLDLIPLVGATLGAAIVTIVGLFVDPVKGLILLAYFLIYQQVENNVLQPLVYGRSVRLHPLAVFLAVLAGGQLLGILGALLAIPVAEIIRILGAEWLAARARETGGEVHPIDSAAPVDQVAADAVGPRPPTPHRVSGMD
ncbi:MAG: AI-2E family transporter [Chloroflexota bacterium]|nr:AI-2E family transporter [Chloroflexota bacterium]